MPLLFLVQFAFNDILPGALFMNVHEVPLFVYETPTPSTVHPAKEYPDLTGFAIVNVLL